VSLQHHPSGDELATTANPKADSQRVGMRVAELTRRPAASRSTPHESVNPKISLTAHEDQRAFFSVNMLMPMDVAVKFLA
jgi:hypothetical protein